jgi:hypothetical protein|tara:strand:+ start:421 stop:1011 length:591 start_codon:yes stop_codon:yes gene_type:complete
LSKYIADGKKQKPGELPKNAYDKVSSVSFYTFNKTPNSIYFGDLNNNIGFFYGSSASFAELDLNLSGTGQITCSKNSKQISGSGTAFTTELVSGDKIQITSASTSQVRIIDSIKNDVSMSVTTNVTLENIAGGVGFSQSLVERKRSLNSKSYINFGKPQSGSEVLMNPTAVSGSGVDEGKILYIYKSGLSGPPKRF